MGRTSLGHGLFYVAVILGLLLSPLTPLFPVAAFQPPAPTVPPAGDDLLIRTRLTLQRPTDRQRLDELGVLVLEATDDSALVLVDTEQLATLARLRFEPRGSQGLTQLVAAHAPAKPWLAASLRSLLARAEAIGKQLKEPETDPATALAPLRLRLRALTPEQQSALVTLTELDSDGDGLTDTEEGWWCTNPNQADSDGDGANDGAEVTAAKDWLANRRSGPPTTGKAFLGWPPQIANCFDDDQDSIPDLAEGELGLDRNRESTDRDKFDDGQELFGNTYCTGQGGFCWLTVRSLAMMIGGHLRRDAVLGKSPGGPPPGSSFPVPEIDVVESSLHVETVTVVTTDHTIAQGTERSYSTAKTEGTSTSIANTESWNDWQEVSEGLQERVEERRAEPSQGLGATMVFIPPGTPFTTEEHRRTTGFQDCELCL